MRVLFLVAAVFMGVGALAADSARPQGSHKGNDPNKDALPTLTVCEALSHPAQYDGKIVRIRDQVVATEEGAGFFGENCPGVYVTDGKVWPSGIAWTMPTDTDHILHPIDFSFDWSTRKKLHKKWGDLRKHTADRCIAVTYTGMFEIWTKTTARKPRGNGWLEIPGFGHLNAAPAQLVLKSADDAAAMPNCTGKTERNDR